VQDYDFGNDYGHKENREGADTAGQYHVLLPDGRVQTVKYSVDKDSGFVAEVVYGNEVTGVRIIKAIK